FTSTLSTKPNSQPRERNDDAAKHCHPASPEERSEGSRAMILGRVIGKVVATMKNATLAGQRLLIVQPIDRNGRDKGKAIVALDSVGAGAGETVYWCRGKEASFPFLPVEPPTDATIVGIVDEINIPAKVESA
ncbi:MAG TPA: EutN/CcmL family microcompartment protein, partial [Terriglobales bacterium]|nr:EutN/CcmL family microcompartment protein [Terriglobales bacterium]